jgi:hypothetical protein
LGLFHHKPKPTTPVPDPKMAEAVETIAINAKALHTLESSMKSPRPLDEDEAVKKAEALALACGPEKDDVKFYQEVQEFDSAVDELIVIFERYASNRLT